MVNINRFIWLKKIYVEELEVNIITTISSRSKGIEGRNRNKIPENINSPNEMQIMRMCNCNTCATGKENSFINFFNHDYLQKSILKEIVTILVEYLHFTNFLEVLVLASRLFEHYKCWDHVTKIICILLATNVIAFSH